MARKTYAQRNQASILKYGKTLYQRRIESQEAKGKTRIEARGHGKAKTHKAPSIEKKIERGPAESLQITSTRFADITKQLNKIPDGQRVYFRMWDNRKGAYAEIYKGKGGAHGVTAGYLRERMALAKETGEAKTDREALLIVLKDDIAGKATGGDTPDDLALPEVITQISMHVQALKAA